MADETTTTWADFFREMKGPLTQALKFKTVLLSEIKRDSNPRLFKGKQVTIPVVNAPQQGVQMLSENGTLGIPVTLDHEQANLKLATIAASISSGIQVVKQAGQEDTSWTDVWPFKMQMVEDMFGKVINEQMNGNGDAKLTNVTSGSGSPGLTVPVGTGANFYQLYAGRIVSVLTRSNGADPGAGKRRKIVSFDMTNGNVVFDTNATATDGGSGNITFSANEGIYIDGSFGNAIAGLLQAAATSGTFQNINKANVQAWQGVDASPTATSDPTVAIFDRAERLSYIKAARQPDFYLVDPAVLDKYSQGIATAARWNGDQVELATGFTGVRYRNKVLLNEFDMAASTAIGISRGDMTVYSPMDGPDWDDTTGSHFQRFNRNQVVEAWLYWYLQFGFHSCNGLTKVGSLNQAS